MLLTENIICLLLVFRHLLLGCSASDLRVGISPITQCMPPDDLVLIIYDARTPFTNPEIPYDTNSAPATRLTASLTTGFGREVWGKSLVLYANAIVFCESG